jgi:glycosyltransferase involved in cell wall biosynthesis
MAARREDPAPADEWVIVAGGFHDLGGMDRANAALAAHLLERGARVHLVGHEIDRRFRDHPRAVCHAVPRPRGLPAAAESLLSRRGRLVASRVTSTAPGARVVVNGGNCLWPDVNWVHAVHAAWPVFDDGAPGWIRLRHRALKRRARRRERAALASARLVIANSDATARAAVECAGVDAAAVRTVYLGADATWGPPDSSEREAARQAFGLAGGAPVVAFVGALGFDVNKGFDVLWEAWRRLAAGGGWDAHLLVAGGGGRLAYWKRAARDAGQSGPVRFLGVTSRVRELLAASDLLVSPVRYEAYGMNVHEALCRGAAVMVSSTAGIVERFGPAMRDAVLPAGVSPDALAGRLRAWRGDMAAWRAAAHPTAERLRSRTWDDMAAEFVSAVGQVPPARRGRRAGLAGTHR